MWEEKLIGGVLRGGESGDRTIDVSRRFRGGGMNRVIEGQPAPPCFLGEPTANRDMGKKKEGGGERKE